MYANASTGAMGLDFDGGCFASKVEVPVGVSPVNISPVRWMIVQGLR